MKMLIIVKKATKSKFVKRFLHTALAAKICKDMFNS